VIGGVGIVIGALLMSFWGRHAPIDRAAPSTSASPPAFHDAVGAGDVDIAIDARIRQVIREELARHDTLNAVPAVPAALPPSPSAVAPTDVVAQMARANAVLDAASTRRSWNEDDATEFRSAIAALPAAERQALMFKFAQAVNDEGMRMETGGAPF
jgi:hypothetical protein